MYLKHVNMSACIVFLGTKNQQKIQKHLTLERRHVQSLEMFSMMNLALLRDATFPTHVLHERRLNAPNGQICCSELCPMRLVVPYVCVMNNLLTSANRKP